MTALFTIAKIWKQPKCPSVDEWVKNLRYIYIMDTTWPEKKRGFLCFAAAWMDLEIIMLSEKTRQRKANTIWISLISGI